MAKLEKEFAAIANESKQAKATSANVDLNAGEIAASKELTQSERINAYLRNNAISHFCAATGENVDEITAILAGCEKEAGVNWLYTAPKFDATHTKEEWEKQNEGAIIADTLAGVTWYKRPFIYGDARGVRSLVNACRRYEDEQKNAQKRLEKKAAAGLEALLLLAEQNGMSVHDYIASLQK